MTSKDRIRRATNMYNAVVPRATRLGRSDQERRGTTMVLTTLTVVPITIADPTTIATQSMGFTRRVYGPVSRRGRSAVRAGAFGGRAAESHFHHFLQL